MEYAMLYIQNYFRLGTAAAPGGDEVVMYDDVQ